MYDGKRGKIFTELHNNRNELYRMYISTVTTFGKNAHIRQLEQVTSELTRDRYDFNTIDGINHAISALIKFKNKQVKNLERLTLDIKDFKREHNAVIATLAGLRYIEMQLNGVSIDMIDEIMEYENDDGNPDIRATRTLRIAEAELTKTLYELYHTRFKCESLCKVTKSIVSRLNRLRETLRA